MKVKRFLFLILPLALSVFASTSVSAQKPKAAAKNARPVILAVLNDGKSVEPIAYVNRGRLENPVNGSDEGGIIAAFSKTYYKPGTVYKMIFGGASAGTVTIKSSNASAECAPNTAVATSVSPKTTLRGMVMALATNAPIANKTAAFRRKPTPAERSDFEGLVRSVFVKNKLTAKELKSQNLTALDVNNDGKAELVGTYWIDVDRVTRGLVFMIAEKGSSGKYAIGHSDYRSIDQEGTMSGDIKNVDEGVYHELLLDVFDYDTDGVGEIFTYVQSFEGAGFTAYKRDAGKWTNIYEFSNYHCGY